MAPLARERLINKHERAAMRRADAMEAKVNSTSREIQRLGSALSEMREDRDRWRAQAEGLTRALEQLKLPEALSRRPSADRVTGAGLAAAANEASADLIQGYAEIGKYLNMTTNTIKHRVKSEGIPVFRMGRIVCARKASLNEWISDQDTRNCGNS